MIYGFIIAIYVHTTHNSPIFASNGVTYAYTTVVNRICIGVMFIDVVVIYTSISTLFYGYT